MNLNRKRIWWVILGKATSKHPSSYDPINLEDIERRNMGMIDRGGFYTRAEATRVARRRDLENYFWHHDVKKMRSGST
jgi:hypothetical protein